MQQEDRPIRIGNFAGFYGDRLGAAREMVDGGPLDVLTGDYLAELTMLILWKARQKDPSKGYATTFLSQMEDVLGTCLDRGVKVVANAGGLNPAGLATDLGTLANRLGLDARIGYVEGDDLMPRLPELRSAGDEFTNLDSGAPLGDREPISANAYLGGFGIAACLDAGADIVVCPRVTDASLVVGPAAWWHGWAHDDYDALAGAVAAGHIIECGPQACGGNYSFLEEVTDRRYPGFPIAEVAADGSSVITKHEETGGLVSPGTVTAQLLYEIAQPAYANPDVVAHFDTIDLTQVGPDRVRVFGTRGTPPPRTLKVAMNLQGGYRNSVTMLLTGLDIEEKAAWAEDLLFAELGGREQFDAVDVRLERTDSEDAEAQELTSARLTVTVKDSDPKAVGRRFSGAATGLFLGGYAGFYLSAPPGSERSYGVYWPTTVAADAVEHRAVLPDGTTHLVAPPPASDGPSSVPSSTGLSSAPHTGPTRRVPLGALCAARSGDKGGNANVGVWTREDDSYSWLRAALTVEELRRLLPEAADLRIDRYELPRLRAVNFVIHGLLGDGVASSTRPDPQAKGLAEFLRSRHLDIPVTLLD